MLIARSKLMYSEIPRIKCRFEDTNTLDEAIHVVRLALLEVFHERDSRVLYLINLRTCLQMKFNVDESNIDCHDAMCISKTDKPHIKQIIW